MNQDEDIEHEERWIYLVIGGAMIPIVLGTLLAHEVFDAGSTISLGLVILAAFGVAGRSWLRRPAVPRARVRK